uniref:EGF-like domain-containing protein n=1 Tax=Syphacia muris TaxID=451379 RepID=A0A158R4Z9_9BILA
MCICTDSVVDCKDRGLTHVPLNLPASAREMYCFLHDLSSNNIVEIAPDAFYGLWQLRELILYKNNISEIHPNTFHGLSNLTTLLLNSNRLHCIWKDTFKNLTNLSLLSLFQNNISSIAAGTFDGLKNLNIIHLGTNPWICDCNLVKKFLFIKFLNKLEKLNFKHVAANEESVCADNGNYCPVNCRCQDTEVKCERKGLKEFPNGIPTDTTYLSLAHNQISIIPKQELNRLRSLTKLDLSDNNLAVIESGTFSNLSHLGMLLLNENDIQCLEDRAFAGLKNLKVLSLYENDISVLPQSAFQDLKSLTMIVMLNNSLYCDCHMAWFSKWLNTNYLDWNELRCDLPLSMRNQKLLTAQSYQFKYVVILAKCNPCLEAPCKNGGTCISGRGRTFTCECQVGFHGEKCEDEIDACYGQPCLNNGTCKGLQYGRFQCYCLEGFSGERCEVNIDDCVEHKCRNGGVCVDRVNGYECKCPSIYGGKFCERKLEYCTEELNPCRNGGKCSKVNDTYKCTCPVGFTDQNCTTNINDCHNHTCQNNGICIDGVNSYICKCSDGYSGKFCELAPIAHYLYQKISPCDGDICGHGTCNDRGDTLVCKCKEGYQGERCDRLRAVGFVDPNAFVELEPWDTEPVGNLTLTLRTYAKTGIIAYYGVDSYFSVELFDGRIKTAFFAGNDRPSHMYSYTIGKCNDNLPHKIQFIINGNALTMKIDESSPQRVENIGFRKNFVVEEKSGLYLGGIPPEVTKSVISKFHVRSTESFKGCISDVFVNGHFVNLEKSQRLVNVQRGCAKAVSLCYGVNCENGGECVVNDMREQGFECKCKGNYKGEFCEQRKVHCGKKRFVDYYVKGSCRSLRKVKQGKCVGWCGEDYQCCKAVKVKPKRLRFRCMNSSGIITKRVNIVRKCECSFASKCNK